MEPHTELSLQTLSLSLSGIKTKSGNIKAELGTTANSKGAKKSIQYTV